MMSALSNGGTYTYDGDGNMVKKIKPDGSRCFISRSHT
jgi:hypothetical protein